jgi:hypothetical protein
VAALSSSPRPPDRDEQAAASSQVERDVVTVRSAIDYPDRNSYIKALEALDRLAAKAHEADALIAQHELCGGAK